MIASASPAATRPVRAADRPLRILTVTNMWPDTESHSGIFVRQQVEATRRLGHRVDVELIVRHRGRTDYVLAAPRVRRRAREGSYDIVHVHFGMTAAAARFAGPTPRVITLYGSDINSRWRRWFTKAGWAGSAARIYVSRRLAERAVDPDGIVIANGVDFKLFAPGDREAARATLGAGADERLVLFGSDPRRTVKGWDLFSAVIARLRSKGLPVRPLILSEPGLTEQGVARKLDAADLLLFTSTPGSEGSPTVVKEAIAMGLPVVSVDVGDVGELLAKVTPSAVVPYAASMEPNGPRGEIVDRLADQAAAVLALRVRADGREQAAWLDLERVAGRIIDVYRSVLRS